MPKELSLTAADYCFAHAIGVDLDAAPSRECVPESAYATLLRAYEHMEAECGQAHRDVRMLREDRDRARWQRNAVCVLMVATFVGFGIALWMNSRMGQ